MITSPWIRAHFASKVILRFDSANEMALGNARRHAEFPRTGNAGWLNSRSRAFCLAENIHCRTVFKLEAERNPGTDLYWLSIDEGRLVLPFSYRLDGCLRQHR